MWFVSWLIMVTIAFGCVEQNVALFKPDCWHTAMTQTSHDILNVDSAIQYIFKGNIRGQHYPKLGYHVIQKLFGN